MKLRTAPLAFGTIVFVSGCASTGGAEDRILGSWQGVHIEQVFRHWGLPARQATLSDGKTLYEWSHGQTVTLPGSTTGTVTVSGGTAYVNAQTRAPTAVTGECTRTFVAGGDGKVAEGYSRGNNCCVMAVAGYCASLLNPSAK